MGIYFEQPLLFEFHTREYGVEQQRLLESPHFACQFILEMGRRKNFRTASAGHIPLTVLLSVHDVQRAEAVPKPSPWEQIHINRAKCQLRAASDWFQGNGARFPLRDCTAGIF